jgi:hypothetical protein
MIDTPLSPTEIDQLREGRGAIYVQGEITYKDFIGWRRYTTFRHYHNGLMGTIGIASGMVYYDEGNDYS